MNFRTMLFEVYLALGPQSVTVRYHRFDIYRWIGRRLWKQVTP